MELATHVNFAAVNVFFVSSRRYARRTWLAAWCAFKRPSGLSGHAHQSKRRNGTTTASLHRRNPYSWPQVSRCSPTAQACPQGTETCRRLPAEPSEPSTLSVISSAGVAAEFVAVELAARGRHQAGHNRRSHVRGRRHHSICCLQCCGQSLGRPQKEARLEYDPSAWKAAGFMQSATSRR